MQPGNECDFALTSGANFGFVTIGYSAWRILLGIGVLGLNDSRARTTAIGRRSICRNTFLLRVGMSSSLSESVRTRIFTHAKIMAITIGGLASFAKTFSSRVFKEGAGGSEVSMLKEFAREIEWK